jgi:hypothetical protein
VWTLGPDTGSLFTTDKEINSLGTEAMAALLFDPDNSAPLNASQADLYIKRVSTRFRPAAHVAEIRRL